MQQEVIDTLEIEGVKEKQEKGEKCVFSTKLQGKSVQESVWVWGGLVKTAFITYPGKERDF